MHEGARIYSKLAGNPLDIDILKFEGPILGTILKRSIQK